VTDIAAATGVRARVLGLHFFNPAPVMPLIEIIATPATDPAVLARAAALMTAWGKVAVLSADTPGFIVNRVNRPFTLEALAMLEAGGTSVDAIDAAVRAGGFPLGPFELMDLTGVDISLAAALGIFERSRAAGDPLAERFRPSPIQERLVADGRLGRKTGRGFYGYDDAGRRLGPAPEFAATGATGGDDAGARIVDLIALAIVNEAYRAAGDGVATPADIDLALRLGASHPRGPFERAADLGGPRAVVAALGALPSADPRFVPAPSLLTAAG
jgi:3-hydroxybutyryl-CoA dehydrogenase